MRLREAAHGRSEHKLEAGMVTSDEAAIQQLISELTDAWNRADAKAYGAL
jgi:hypothetical protein